MAHFKPRSPLSSCFRPQQLTSSPGIHRQNNNNIISTASSPIQTRVMSSQQNSESILGVQSWVYAVAAATRPEQSSNQRLLRPRLASTSLNPRLRKRSPVEEGSEGLKIPRKRTKVMADQPPQLHEEGARGRGRGRGRPRGQGQMRVQHSTRGQAPRGGLDWSQGHRSLDQQTPMLPPPEDFAQFIPSTLPSRSHSPSKRSNTISKPKSDANIDMTFLQTCNPSVCLRDSTDVREQAPLPALVQNLYNALVVNVPTGFIPISLKVSNVPLYLVLLYLTDS